MNLSRPTPVDKLQHSNNAAEICGVMMAIVQAKSINLTKLCIYTDSKHVMDTVNNNLQRWNQFDKDNKLHDPSAPYTEALLPCNKLQLTTWSTSTFKTATLTKPLSLRTNRILPLSDNYNFTNQLTQQIILS